MAAACPQCGFDPLDWDEADARRTLRRAGFLLRHAVAGLPPALQPAVDRLPGASGDDIGTDPATDPDAELAAVHRLVHHCAAIADLRAAAGDLPPEQRGRVEQLNTSDGGVPKRPVPEAVVGRRGLLGDRQLTRRHHGRVWQALCLWSAEVVEALQAEGHAIGFGSAGENVTIRGLDWSAMRSGLLIDIGAVRARVTVPAEPCFQNDGWFTDNSSQRIAHDRHPGWSRWYATVERDGTMRHGDTVVLAPRSG